MTITFLGTGTSQGVPMIGCSCAVCQSKDKRDNRLRSAIWVRTGNTSVVIDTGPDFRYQMLRARVHRLDAIVYTHGHKDHVAGLDDVRAFNYWQQEPIAIYANAQTEEVLRREFQYVFNGIRYPGIPQVDIVSIENKSSFQIGDLIFHPIKVLHYKLEVYGFRIGDFCYVTDVNFIRPEELAKIKGCKILVISALRKEKHISHFSLEEAIAISRLTGAGQTYLTHISHQMGLAAEVERELPTNIHLSYDGLTLEV
ncbi:MAG TPA: MBL fold metallo-hydrolase [Edaphocola sp.]|nr:MBL fold metallo-hydrolase [Edaphocola sp.]